MGVKKGKVNPAADPGSHTHTLSIFLSFSHTHTHTGWHTLSLTHTRAYLADVHAHTEEVLLPAQLAIDVPQNLDVNNCRERHRLTENMSWSLHRSKLHPPGERRLVPAHTTSLPGAVVSIRGREGGREERLHRNPASVITSLTS